MPTPIVGGVWPQPDVVVVPGVAGYDIYSERFQVVAEVLSPTNRRQEIDLKLRRYREAPHNLYAVVIEPRKFLVEIYAKRASWQPTVLTKTGRVLNVIDLAREYGFTDVDGTMQSPFWERHWDGTGP